MLTEYLSQYPQLISHFGSISNFLQLYNSVFSNQYNLYKLLQFESRDVHILNNSLYKINLNQTRSGFVYEDSILTDYPYHVLNSVGETLYSVSDHEGVFGNSLYDKYLITDSSTVGMYILSYSTYRGNKMKLLLINNEPDVLPAIDYTPDLNVIYNTDNKIEGKNVMYVRGDDVVLYYLAKPISTFISSELIELDQSVETINSNSGLINYVPTESGWFFVKQNNVAVNSLSYTGNGLDRVIRPFDNEVHYLFVNNVFNKSFLKRFVGVTSFTSNSVQLNITV